MSTSNTQTSAEEKRYQVPEWEHTHAREGNDAAKTRATPKAAFASKFDAVLPPHRRYVGMSRKVFLWVLLAVILALLALIIGLAVGLSKSRYISHNVTEEYWY